MQKSKGFCMDKKKKKIIYENEKECYICARKFTMQNNWRNGGPDSYREVEAAVTANSCDWRNGRVVDRGSLENC